MGTAFPVPALAGLRGELPRTGKWSFMTGCALLGLSSAPEDSLGVQSFGLPFLLLTLFFGLPNVARLTNSARPVRILALIVTAFASVSWMVITCFWSAQPFPSLSRALINVLGLVLFIFFTLVAPGGSMPAILLRRVVFGTTLATSICAAYYVGNLIGVLIEFGPAAVFVERFVGGLMSLPWGASNTIAAVLLLGVGVTLIHRNLYTPLTLWIALLVQIAAVIFTLSRNGSALMALLVWLGTTRTEHRRILTWLVAVAFIVALVSATIVDAEAVTALLDDRLSGGEDLSNGRVDQWAVMLGHVMSDPFGMVGYYGSIYTFELSAHNFLLNTLVEQGFPGLLLAVAFVYQLFTLRPRTAGTNVRSNPLTYPKLWCVVALNLSFEDPNFTQPYIIVFWLVVASQVLFLLTRHRQKLGLPQVHNSKPMSMNLATG